MLFAGALPSFAEGYPDGKVLLKRLGVTLNTDGKPVADGTGGCLPEAYDVLTMQDSEKLTYLCGDETAQKKRRWNVEHDFPYDEASLREAGLQIDTKAVRTVPKRVASREFLEGVFGEDFIDAFLKKAGDSEEKIYTTFSAAGKFPEFESIREGYKCRVSSFDSVLSSNPWNEWEKVHRRECSALRNKMYLSLEAYEKVLKQYELQQQKSLWGVWEAYRNAFYLLEEDKVSALGNTLLEELEKCSVLSASKNSPKRHPVWTSFEELRTSLTDPLSRASDLWKKRKFYYDEEAGKEKKKFLKPLMESLKEGYLKDGFSKYRNRFAGEEYLKNGKTGEKFPISTDPLTVDIWIYQKRCENENGARKLYTEEWEKRVIDLNIKLRLTIDTRTRKLLSAFCKDKFVVNGQAVTDFGTGLCIFKSE